MEMHLVFSAYFVSDPNSYHHQVHNQIRNKQIHGKHRDDRKKNKEELQRPSFKETKFLLVVKRYSSNCSPWPPCSAGRPAIWYLEQCVQAPCLIIAVSNWCVQSVSQTGLPGEMPMPRPWICVVHNCSPSQKHATADFHNLLLVLLPSKMLQNLTSQTLLGIQITW